MNAALRQVIAGLSRKEKLQLIESLWESLVDSADQIEVPASHEAELQKREQYIANGQSIFSDWEEARKRIFSAVRK